VAVCLQTNDVNPREWLTDVLTQIPMYNNDYSLDLADLLPHNWKQNIVEFMTKGNKKSKEFQ
jgi:hypothetical protein